MDENDGSFLDKTFPKVTLICAVFIIIGGTILVLLREWIGLAFFMLGVLLLLAREKIIAKHKPKNHTKKKALGLIVAIVLFISGIVFIANPPKTEEDVVIELSKIAFDQYAPEYEYRKKTDNWFIIFNADNTVTVWAPAYTPDSNENYMRGVVMLRKENEDFVVYYVETDGSVKYYED